MRTTINLKDSLYEEATRATGIKEKTALLHRGLEALLREEAVKRLTKLYGTHRKAKAPRRRRSS